MEKLNKMDQGSYRSQARAQDLPSAHLQTMAPIKILAMFAYTNGLEIHGSKWVKISMGKLNEMRREVPYRFRVMA